MKVRVEDATKDQLCYMVGTSGLYWQPLELAKRIKNGCEPVNLGSVAELLDEQSIYAKPHKSLKNGYHYTAAKWNPEGDIGRFPSMGSTSLEACMRCYLRSIKVEAMTVPDLSRVLYVQK